MGWASFSRDTRHEAHTRALAVWSKLGGVIVAAGAVITLATSEMPGGQGATIVFAVVGVLSYVLGHGLWNYNSVARWITVIFTILGIVGTVFSVVKGPDVMRIAGVGQALWNCALLWSLLGEAADRVFSLEYRAAIRGDTTTKIHFWTSPFFVLPIVLVVLGVIAGFVAGAMAAAPGSQ